MRPQRKSRGTSIKPTEDQPALKMDQKMCHQEKYHRINKKINMFPLLSTNGGQRRTGVLCLCLSPQVYILQMFPPLSSNGGQRRKGVLCSSPKVCINNVSPVIIKWGPTTKGSSLSVSQSLHHQCFPRFHQMGTNNEREFFICLPKLATDRIKHVSLVISKWGVTQTKKESSLSIPPKTCTEKSKPLTANGEHNKRKQQDIKPNNQSKSTTSGANRNINSI